VAYKKGENLPNKIKKEQFVGLTARSIVTMPTELARLPITKARKRVTSIQNFPAKVIFNTRSAYQNPVGNDVVLCD